MHPVANFFETIGIQPESVRTIADFEALTKLLMSRPVQFLPRTWAIPV